MLRTLALAMAAALGLFAVNIALADAEPASLKPGQDSVLTSAPTEIVILMTQEMARMAGANDIVLQDSNGTEVTRQPATIDDANRKKLSVPIPGKLLPGTYTVRWRTTSADDGDTRSGNYAFKFDPAGPAAIGREVVGQDVLPSTTPAAGVGISSVPTGSSSGGGTSWVLVAAVAVAMFVLGAGSAFVLVQKRE